MVFFGKIQISAPLSFSMKDNVTIKFEAIYFQTEYKRLLAYRNFQHLCTLTVDERAFGYTLNEKVIIKDLKNNLGEGGLGLKSFTVYCTISNRRSDLTKKSRGR